MGRHFVEDDVSYYPDPSNEEAARTNQIEDAVGHLSRHPDSLVRWPYPDLDALTGPMGGGEVWMTAAFSGGGKTTFVASTIDRWRLAKKRVYVMPLELSASRFRTYLGCMETGIHPGEALSGALRADLSRKDDLDRLKAAVRGQNGDDYAKYIRVSPQTSINVEGLTEGISKAYDFHADIVVVDHIDHITGGDGTNLYNESVAVNNIALDLARESQMLLWFTSQLNMEIGKGRDHLAKFGAPMQHHLMFPTAKLKNATGIIGLFRPLRGQSPTETPKEYAAAIKAARAGLTDAPHSLQAGVMGVNAMKLRNFGHNEGKKIALGFEKGRVVPLLERDRWTTASGYPRPAI